jgi:hypothetical protein
MKYGWSLLVEDLVSIIWDPESIAKPFVRERLKEIITNEYNGLIQEAVNVNLIKKQYYPDSDHNRLLSLIQKCDTDRDSHFLLFSFCAILNKAVISGFMLGQDFKGQTSYLEHIEKTITNSKELSGVGRDRLYEEKTKDNHYFFKSTIKRIEFANMSASGMKLPKEFEKFRDIIKSTQEKINEIKTDSIESDNTESLDDKINEEFAKMLKEVRVASSEGIGDARNRMLLVIDPKERELALTETEKDIFKQFEELKNLMYKSIWEKDEKDLNKAIEQDLTDVLSMLFEMYKDGDIYAFGDKIKNLKSSMKDEMDFIKKIKEKTLNSK